MNFLLWSKIIYIIWKCLEINFCWGDCFEVLYRDINFEISRFLFLIISLRLGGERFSRFLRRLWNISVSTFRCVLEQFNNNNLICFLVACESYKNLIKTSPCFKVLLIGSVHCWIQLINDSSSNNSFTIYYSYK